MKIATITAAVLCGLLAGTAAWAAPQVQVEQPVYDFGEIYQGQGVKHLFTFKNTGDQLLQVDKVRSSCGCTAVLATAQSLQPGEAGEVQATFDSSRFRGDIAKTIYLSTNDPDQPTVQMTLKGHIREVVSVDPAQINFGAIASGTTVTQDVVLENHGTQEFALNGVQTTVPELEAQLLDTTLPPGKTATLQVKLNLKPGQPRFSGYVMLTVAGASKPEVRIPVYATLKP